MASKQNLPIPPLLPFFQGPWKWLQQSTCVKKTNGMLPALPFAPGLVVLTCCCVGSVLWLHRAGANSPLAIAASLASPAPDMLESKGRYTCLCSFYVSFHLPSLISPLEAGLAVSKEVWSVSEISFILKRSPENFPLDTAMWNRTSERAPVLQSDMLIIFTFRSLNIFSIPPFHCSNTLAQP